MAWTAVILAALAAVAQSALDAFTTGSTALIVAFLASTIIYLALQYARTESPGTFAGAAVGVLGAIVLCVSAGLIQGWPQVLAAAELVAGAVLLGAVTNGMLLGHWYLNQPGLKPWALARLTDLSLVAILASGLLGVAAVTRLAGASTAGAAFSFPGFGDSFGRVFFVTWLALVVFTGVVVLMARRCVAIRSIQSATGLYYVAILTAGVSEFLVRYLMVNAA